MIQRINSTWLVLFVAVFGLAACGGDSGEATSEAVAQTPAAANPCAENTGEANPCAEMEVQELPEGVTSEMVAEGKTLFGGAGICMSCHAPDGSGVPNLGADLTDDEWTHSDGGYEGIVKTVLDGVTADASTSGIPMPPKGGSSISDDQANAIAAYVWTLSR